MDWIATPSDFAALPAHRKSLNGALLQLGTRAPTKASSGADFCRFAVKVSWSSGV